MIFLPRGSSEGLGFVAAGALRFHAIAEHGINPFMANKKPKPKTPEVCPVCGEDVPRGALACPECGADHESGWREGAEIHDGLELPAAEEEFDYDEFLEKEFGASPKPEGIKTVWWITAGVLLLLSVVGAMLALR